MSAPKRGNTILNLGEDMVETFDWDQLYIPLDKIDERPGFNPRTDYGEHDGTFAALVESIRDRGMLELPRLMPIVDKRGDWDPCECRFTIVAGHRRIAAAKALGWNEIRACVPDADGKQLAKYDDGQQLVDALVENLQRKELNCIEVAEGIARLEKLGKTQADIAKWIGRDQGRVSKTVRLLELPDAVRALLREGVLSASHGEELLPLLAESFLPGEIYSLAQSAVDMSLTKSGLRNVVQDKIKRGQPVQTTIDEIEEPSGDYALAHNSPVPPSPRSAGVSDPKPLPREDNGLTRKDSDSQFAAAMAPDHDVVPLSELPGGASELSPNEDKPSPELPSSAKGTFFFLPADAAKLLFELSDWHRQEHGDLITADEKLADIVRSFHTAKLEQKAEAEAAKAALAATLPVFEIPEEKMKAAPPEEIERGVKQLKDDAISALYDTPQGIADGLDEFAGRLV